MLTIESDTLGGIVQRKDGLLGTLRVADRRFGHLQAPGCFLADMLNRRGQLLGGRACYLHTLRGLRRSRRRHRHATESVVGEFTHRRAGRRQRGRGILDGFEHFADCAAEVRNRRVDRLPSFFRIGFRRLPMQGHRVCDVERDDLRYKLTFLTSVARENLCSYARAPNAARNT